MEKKIIELKGNSLGEATEIILMNGFIEKIEVFYSESSNEDVMTELEIKSNLDELILKVSGNKSRVFYPLTFASSPGGDPLTFDGNHFVPVKFFVNEHLLVNLKTFPESEVIRIVLFYRESLRLSDTEDCYDVT